MRPRDNPRYARITPDPYRRQGVTRVVLSPHAVRFLLDRSSESAERAEPSQDYLVVQNTPGGLCFAVTDGVGSSFLGELAARLLATYLVDLLAELRAVPDEGQLADGLTSGLHQLSDEVRQDIRRYPIATHVPGVVQSVLSERREYGSEAMFACGRIDVAEDRPTRVALAWLGDSNVRVMTDAGEESLTGTTMERWSTERGPRGTVHVWTEDARRVRRIIACTDGLLPEIASVLTLSDDELDVRLAALTRRADSDDIALVDIALRADAMPPPLRALAANRGTGETTGLDEVVPSPVEPVSVELSEIEPSLEQASPLNSAPENFSPAEPSPAKRQAATSAPEAPRTAGTRANPVSPDGPKWLPRTEDAALSWVAIPDAEEYTVEFDCDPGFAEPIAYRISRTEFTAPPMGSRSWVRVRGHVQGRDGQWSEPLELSEVPAPFEGAPRRPIIRSARVDERRGRVYLEWDGVPGRDTYVLRLELVHHPDRVRQLRIFGHQATLSLTPAHYRISVCADPREKADGWSDRIEVRVR